MPKVVPYSEKNYVQKKNLFDTLAQVFQDVKHGEVHTAHRWNQLSEQIQGCTMKLLSDGLVQLTAHRYEITTLEGLTRSNDMGTTILDEMEKSLKKEFKKKTDVDLKLKKVKEHHDVEKHSRIYSDVSPIWSGKTERPIARYLVRDTRVYEFDASL